MFHRSERLLLRPGWQEDAAELTARIADEAIVRNLSRVPWPYQEQHAAEWLAIPKQAKWPTLLITLPSAYGTPIIGACGLHEQGGQPEIGYWIARDHWGQGYATEAARAVLSIARALGHRRVYSCHAVDNPASGKVLRKAGFKPTGQLRTIHSLGRGTDISAHEFATDLGASVGDPGPPVPMPRAA
ncbi:MAG: GNAT family N-acetyltransferase [Candidatus Andeanibacterium colombiense]|uniref:GNAT family N-acetyltransferase n=1 Tax=Candidatus Andeanibacterium colombiense TaxID=3121345 RepID=A0AAJ5X7V0_9SPHN|nr:MAG: GNAT family N-acetyltransferase [Sphingomonadaceae bacterium]